MKSKGNIIIDHSSIPELVDIKLTDYCPYNCAFCYQDSTVRGKHAEHEEISYLIRELRNMEVIEVALGGGDPTLHPDFADILLEFHNYNIIANFTTKNLAWLRNPKEWVPIIKHSGGFAFSANKREEIEELSALIKLIPIRDIRRQYQITIQHVVGVDYSIKSILETAQNCNFTVTLLGYKTTGRGSDFKPKLKPDEAFEEVKKYLTKNRWLRLGIDTVLVQQWKKQLSKYVPDSLYTLEEGKFSMYIDAVAGTAGPSSFCDPKLMQPYNFSHYKLGHKGKTLTEIYQSFNEKD